MTLQRKFAALLSILTLSVIVNVATALWTLRFSQRELVEPLRNINRIQPSLGSMKQEIMRQASLLGPKGDVASFPFPKTDEALTPPERRGQFEASVRKVNTELADLAKLDQYPVLVGISTTRNLLSRFDEAVASAKLSLDDDAPQKRDEAISQYRALHDLIERMESTVAGNAQTGLSQAEVLSPEIVLIIGTSAASVILTMGLGSALMRRWVVQPVSALRQAADRLARGDFTHRVPVTGQDELGQLSAEVNHMAGMISTMQEERVDRERLAAAGEVVRRLAHNLRNPLAGIRSLAELTRSDLAPEAPARENQDRIVQTVDRFERWLAEMLSATTPLKVEPQRVSIAPWLTGLIQPLTPLAASRGVTIKLNTASAPAVAMFDPRHLEQAMVGIVNNAIQASPRAGAVEVTAKAGQDGKTWELHVADQGSGVPPELVEKIFRPYFTTKRDGTGIGLAVARQVVDQHAGRIRVEPGLAASESAPGGRGARFVIALPLDGPPTLANTGQGS